MKATTTKVQEWTTTVKSQECDTTTKSQECIATTRARNWESQEQLTNRDNWQPLRRPSQKQNGILRKRLIYYQELRPKLKRHETKT